MGLREVTVYRGSAGQAPEEAKRVHKTGITDTKNYVLNSWFPVNGTLLRELQKKMAAGAYDHNRHELIEDLKSDFTLFAAFIKGLPEIGSDNNGSVNPSEVLHEAEIDTLKKILGVSESQISTHSFSSMLKSQAVRVKHSLVSCSTADLVASKADTDSVSVYTAALFRQLGHNLLAWNYPRIYSRVLNQVSAGEGDLDRLLIKAFGFSPLNLAADIAEDWNLAPEIRYALGQDLSGEDLSKSPLNPKEIKRVSDQINKFCNIGETMAKIGDPEHFPDAPFHWKKVSQEVLSILGPNGLDILTTQVEALTARYQAYAPTLFESKMCWEENLEKANEHHAENQLSRNPDVNKCPPDLQEVIKHVYRYVIPGQVSTQALELLIGKVIPLAGFEKGCLYLVDAHSMKLVPTLKIGNRPVEHYKPLMCGHNTESNNPVVAALSSMSPIRQEGALMHGERVSITVGQIGNSEKQGVLYLEMSDHLTDAPSHEALLRFRAICKCLNECLGLT